MVAIEASRFPRGHGIHHCARQPEAQRNAEDHEDFNAAHRSDLNICLAIKCRVTLVAKQAAKVTANDRSEAASPFEEIYEIEGAKPPIVRSAMAMPLK